MLVLFVQEIGDIGYLIDGLFLFFTGFEFLRLVSFELRFCFEVFFFLLSFELRKVLLGFLDGSFHEFIQVLLDDEVRHVFLDCLVDLG